jgi:hypothetical protein
MSGALALAARTRAFIRTWPAITRAAGTGWIDGCRDSRQARASHYWLVLPRWLNRRLRVHEPGALDDIVWAQYCLFAFVRLQDDVLDRQVEQARLLFVAHEFLVEGERALARHVRDERVWRYFRAALRQTARGILEADALQRGPAGRTDRLVASYRRVSAVLKVGAAAVCLPCGADGALRRASLFADHLAVAGQLLDDLEDALDDLGQGRLNAAARILVPRGSPASRDIRRDVSRALMVRPVGPLVARIRRNAGLARAAIAPLRLAGAAGYIRRIERELLHVERAVHRARVRAVFAAIRSGTDPPRHHPPSRIQPRGSAR